MPGGVRGPEDEGDVVGNESVYCLLIPNTLGLDDQDTRHLRPRRTTRL